MKSILAMLLMAALIFAGCSSPAQPEGEAVAPREDINLSYIKTGAAVGPDLNATTAAAPRLIEGEWWRIKYDSDFFGAESTELLRVVANASSDGYVFGMPHERWIKEAISFHAPAFGDVGLDLSYDTHNTKFQPVQFPLVQGATWETVFAGGKLIATVDSADTYTAEVSFRSPPSNGDPTTALTDLLGLTDSSGFALRLTYDARMHEVVRMESPIGSWEVIDHGFQFVGWVSVPKGGHTALDYGVFGPQMDNPLPSRTIQVSDAFNRITVLHAVFSLSPGAFRITSLTPDGQKFVTELVGPAGVKAQIFEVDNPAGAWQQEDLAAGLGGTYTMGIAYEQYDILVPYGDRRGTHGHEVTR